MIPDKLKDMGYTEEDLEQSNPYNQWLVDTQSGRKCPKCNETEISHLHHESSYSADECDFFLCTSCGHQWGHE